MILCKFIDKKVRLNGCRGVGRSLCGFTLVEMMITVMVMAILLAIAVPSFRNMVINNQVRTFGYNLYSSLLLSRSEAIKRNTNVTVCASSNGTSCTGSWSQGWITFVGSPSTVGTVVQHMGTQNGSFSLSGLPIGIYYDSQSASHSCISTVSCALSSTSLAICPVSASTSTPCWCISLSPYGTPMIDKSSNGTSCS
jgi:type IV fimbrial biogenesis protein FimT